MRRLKDTRGGDQSGLRNCNKRLILNVIGQHGALPKAEIARITGLTAQSVSVIFNALLGKALDDFDMTGLSPATPRPGTIGSAARALGAAILPFIRNFSPDQELLVKKASVAT